MHDLGKFHVQILTEQDGNGTYILVQSGNHRTIFRLEGLQQQTPAASERSSLNRK